jgi:hypothetical protein
VILGHLEVRKTVPAIRRGDHVRYVTITVIDGTERPVDRVPGGRRIGMFRGQAATTWPCGSAFPIWWPSTRSRPVVIEDHHWRRRETAEAVRRRRVPPPSNWFIVGSPMFDERKRAGFLTG